MSATIGQVGLSTRNQLWKTNSEHSCTVQYFHVNNFKWRLSQGQRQNMADCCICGPQETSGPPSIHALVLNLGLAMWFALVKGTLISQHGEYRGLISTLHLGACLLGKKSKHPAIAMLCRHQQGHGEAMRSHIYTMKLLDLPDQVPATSKMQWSNSRWCYLEKKNHLLCEIKKPNKKTPKN